MKISNLKEKLTFQLKKTLRNLFIGLKIDVTKNIEYDRLTNEILASRLKANSNCIDIGCHKGEILDAIIKYAPKGHHYAIEPIPEFFNKLKTKYTHNVELFNCALGETEGTTNFNYVVNAPAYSGIKERAYKIANPDIQKINVDLKTLDSIIPEQTKIDLIKIDVEGGELGVLLGAKNIITKNKPLILFECGLGASEYYKTLPEDIFKTIASYQLQLYTLKGFLKNETPLTEADFNRLFLNNSEYYFIAGI